MDDLNDNHSLLEKLKSPQKESGDDGGDGDDRWLEISVLEQRLAEPLVSTEKHQSSVIMVVTSFLREREVGDFMTKWGTNKNSLKGMAIQTQKDRDWTTRRRTNDATDTKGQGTT